MLLGSSSGLFQPGALQSRWGWGRERLAFHVVLDHWCYAYVIIRVSHFTSLHLYQPIFIEEIIRR